MILLCSKSGVISPLVMGNERLNRFISLKVRGWFGLDDWARDSLALFTPLLFSGIGPCLE